MDGRRIGLRWSEPGLDDGVRELLAPELVDGDAPPNIAVVVGEQEGGVRAKHQLFVQAKLVLISASAERIHRAIVRAIADLTAVQQPVDCMTVRAAVVITADGRAVLVDRRLGQDLWNLDRRLRRQGCRVIDSAAVTIDLATCSVVLTDPADLLADDVGAGAHSSEPDGLDELRGGPIPISRLVFMSYTDGESLSERLAEAAPITMRPDDTLHGIDVARLLEVVRRTETHGVAADDAGALMAAIGLPTR